MKHISLFSGIGGDTLAAEWAGFETVLFVENDKFCQKILRKHWPNVPLLEDIKDVTKETMADAQCQRRQSRELYTGDQSETLRRRAADTSSPSNPDRYGQATIRDSSITLITGGFPCQPVSVAGKQRGKEDDRWLWPEMLRVITEVRPTWVVAENVAGLIRMGLDDCISDLENIGYTTETYIIPACAVNAPHRRDRVFIVGYSQYSGSGFRLPTNRIRQANDQRRDGFSQSQPCQRSQDVADTTGIRQQGQGEFINASNTEENRKREADKLINECVGNQWAVEPDVGRVAHGIPSRVDRLKCLGNAIVPQQIYPILKAIADIELDKVNTFMVHYNYEDIYKEM